MKFDPDIFDAVELGDLESVKMYWDDDTDVDAQDLNGMTLLMLAVYYKNKEIVQFLLEKGGRIQLKNNKGKTAIDIAIGSENKDILKILRDKLL